MHAIGALVVGAAQIERAHRIVNRPDLVERAKTMLQMLDGVTHRRRLQRSRMFAEAANGIEPRTAELVRAGRVGGG